MCWANGAEEEPTGMLGFFFTCQLLNTHFDICDLFMFKYRGKPAILGKSSLFFFLISGSPCINWAFSSVCSTVMVVTWQTISTVSRTVWRISCIHKKILPVLAHESCWGLWKVEVSRWYIFFFQFLQNKQSITIYLFIYYHILDNNLKTGNPRQ